MKTKNFTLLFLVAISLLSACKKSQQGPTQPTITATYYLKGTLNGQPLLWQAATDNSLGYIAASSAALELDKGVTTGVMTAYLAGPEAKPPGLAFEFGTFQVNSSQDVTAYFDSFVNTGAWTYAVSENYTVGAKAIILRYTDPQGKEYWSIGSQSSGSLNVLGATPMQALPGQLKGLKIKLAFSCTLYPKDGTGSSLSLTNAEATVLLTDLLH